MNNKSDLYKEQDTKIDLIIRYIDGDITKAECSVIDNLLMTDDFSKGFYQNMVELDAQLISISRSKLTGTASSQITNKLVSEFARKQTSKTAFKSYGLHVILVSFIVLTTMAAYSIKHGELSPSNIIYANWGNYIGTFFLVGMSALLLLIFDMILKSKSMNHHHYKHS